MIGFREPGYLWMHKDIPYVHGPIGGYNQYPSSFFSILNLKGKLFYFLRNIINLLQSKLLQRPKKAYKRANQVILASDSGIKIVEKFTKKTPIILTETGAHRIFEENIINNIEKNNKQLTLTWVGLLTGRKALPIALKAIAKSKHKDNIQFNIIGTGPDEETCKELALKLKLKNISWKGSIPHEEAKKAIANSDMLFFSSLLEATSTVIFEALQANTPVICHDTCGFGNVIDDTCGVKIPVISVTNSIDSFANEIDKLYENPNKLNILKQGCQKRLEEYYWDQKGIKLFNIYQQCLAQ